MPFSRSRSIESMTRSATSWFCRKAPVCQSMASTSVVFPWSTWATIATLRRSSRTAMRQLKLAGVAWDAWAMTDLERFAGEWYEAWNGHDLEAVLEHYADNVVFTSPFVARLAGGDGTLHGRGELRWYFATAFQPFPDLPFEPIAVATGV